MATGEKRNPRKTKGTEEENEKGFKYQWNVSNTWKAVIFIVWGFFFPVGVYFELFKLYQVKWKFWILFSFSRPILWGIISPKIFF